MGILNKVLRTASQEATKSSRGGTGGGRTGGVGRTGGMGRTRGTAGQAAGGGLLRRLMGGRRI